MSDNNLSDKLKSSAISIGKELPMDVYAKNGILLLKRGHYVLSPDMKHRLIKLGFAEQPAEVKPAEKTADNYRKGQSLFEEIVFLQQRVRNMLQHALTQPDLEQRVRAIAQTIISLSERHPDGLMASMLLLPFQEYGVAHSLHTTALLTLITRQMKLPAGHREILLCAALTMNIAQIELQNELFSHEGQLTPQQRSAIKEHPLLSSAILREAGIENELWHALVQTHHENWQGSGYPFGLERKQILPPAHLLHLADIACAKLAPRRYRSAQLPATALGNLFQRKDVDFDSAFTTMLIRELGIYPPGSFVKLVNNEIAVVLARRDKPSEPQVAALRKADGPAYAEVLLRETSHSQYKIAGPCSFSMAGVRISFLASLWKI
ncbi:phosphohydrolase [Aquitalea sp. FJL05]|uniref:HD-GYP domain-containing protein n=1 Tax=Aquitalea TaxID=407217 RepID=UPI000F5A0E25|nr:MULTISPECIES: HD domain-containing phosphohydrolase [Aquitalea]RQO66667.1 phosphohydrolase [Aquitalea sp. FJL05]